MQNKSAGQIQNEIFKKDFGSYDARDLGYAINEDLSTEISECIQRHADIFASKDFCVVLQLCLDPKLISVLRRKFYAWPYLPSPNFSQNVWLWKDQKIRFLWSLPDEKTMLYLTESDCYPPQYDRMKKWSNWFYNGTFWHNIRKEHNIDMLSEWEFNRRNRKKGGKFISDDIVGDPADPLYLPEIRIKKLEAKYNPSGSELLDNSIGQAN